MRKQINHEFHSGPEVYDEKFDRKLGIFDTERFEKLAKYFTGGVYVDVGCFDSVMPALLAERYPDSEIHAIDHAPGMIAFLASHLPKVKYAVGNCYKLDFKDNSVDCVVAGEIIEHLERPEDFVKEALRILKPGGYLAVSTPFEERGHDIGGPYHMWRWEVKDVAELLGTGEVEVLQEETNKTILAWRKK